MPFGPTFEEFVEICPSGSRDEGPSRDRPTEVEKKPKGIADDLGCQRGGKGNGER